MKEKLDDIYTDYHAQEVARENPDSFWSKFIIDPFEKFVVKIKKKKKIYSFAEKRVLVEKRKKKRLIDSGKEKPKNKKTKKLKKPK